MEHELIAFEMKESARVIAIHKKKTPRLKYRAL